MVGVAVAATVVAVIAFALLAPGLDPSGTLPEALRDPPVDRAPGSGPPAPVALPETRRPSAPFDQPATLSGDGAATSRVSHATAELPEVPDLPESVDRAVVHFDRFALHSPERIAAAQEALGVELSDDAIARIDRHHRAHAEAVQLAARHLDEGRIDESEAQSRIEAAYASYHRSVARVLGVSADEARAMAQSLPE